MAAAIEAYGNAGVEHVILALNSGDVDSIRRVMENVASEVIPQLR